jgi:hypothetical protein
MMLRAACAIVCLAAGAVPALAQMPPVAPGQNWWLRAPVYRSTYYNIKTDIPPEEARPLAEHMDATFEAYMALFCKLPVRVRRPATLDLYLFAGQADYLNVLRLRFDDDGTGSWGKCITVDKTISVVGFRGQHSNDEVKRLLQHEGFHQVSSHFFSGMPPWAGEGLAELFEDGVPVSGQLVVGEFPADDQRRLLAAIQSRSFLPLDQLLALDSEQWGRFVIAGDADVNYLQAWSVVHFLVFSEGGKYEAPFLSFLVQLNRSTDWRKAFVASFGMPDFRAIEAKWIEYVRSTPPSDYRETARRLDFLAAGMAELRKQGIYPLSLAELEQQLQNARFVHDSELFGVKRRLSAADPEMFGVPLAEGVPDRQFALVALRGAAGGRSSQEPPPCTIAATGRGPNVFLVTWARRGGQWAYSLSAIPAAQWARKAPAARKASQQAASADKPEPTAGRENAPSAARFRTWTSADRRFTTEARLVDYAGRLARLEKPDGRVVEVGYEQLSAVDRQFLDRWRTAQGDAQGPAPGRPTSE